MTATQQQIQLAAQLYEARDAARTILGPKFAPLMTRLGQDLTSLATARGKQPLAVAIQAGRALGGGMDAIFLLAAAVELAEPSIPTTTLQETADAHA